MEEKLNIAEILKDAPTGIRLWSPICGECELVEVDEDYSHPIKCKPLNGDSYWRFRRDGSLTFSEGAECVLFPTKKNRNWSTFKTHKYFEPFQKVLRVADNSHDCEVWAADFYSHHDESTFEHYLVSGFVKADDEVIPYEGNEDKLGKQVK